METVSQQTYQDFQEALDRLINEAYRKKDVYAMKMLAESIKLSLNEDELKEFKALLEVKDTEL